MSKSTVTNSINTNISQSSGADRINDSEVRAALHDMVDFVQQDITGVTAVISFPSMSTSLPDYPVTGPFSFSTNLADACKNGVTTIKVLPDGINTPFNGAGGLPGFKKLKGTQPYDNTVGTPNIFFFWYDGADVYFAVTQVDAAASPSPTVLNAPTSIVLTAGGSGEINQTWVNNNTSPGATNNKLWLRTTNTFPGGTPDATALASATSKLWTGLTPGATYYGFVVAGGDGTSTADSTPGSGTGAAGSGSSIPQLTVSGWDVLNVDSTTNLISYDPEPNAVDGTLEFSLNGTSGWTGLNNPRLKTSSGYTHNFLTPGTPYYYRFRWNGDGVSYLTSNYVTGNVTTATGGTTDTDATAWLTAAGVTSQQYYHDFFAGLKTDGLWAKTIGLYIMLDDFNKSKFNLKDPQDLDGSYRLTRSGTPLGTFAANGYTGPGNGGEQITTHIPANVNSNASMIMADVKAAGSGVAVSFGQNGSGETYIWESDPSMNHLGRGISGVSGAGAGRWYVGGNATEAKGYKNGSQVGSTTTASPTAVSNELRIGGGSATNYASNGRSTIFGVFQYLSASEVAALDARIVTLEIAMGR